MDLLRAQVLLRAGALKGETGTEESSQVSTQKNELKNGPFSDHAESRIRTLASGFTAHAR